MYNNTVIVESVLRKKRNSIAYHQLHKSVAAGTIRVVTQKAEDNLADLFTKVLTV